MNHPAAGQGSAAVRVAVRPLASPLPVGMLALTVGSTVLCGSQLHWVPADEKVVLALGLLAFVAPLQFVAFLFAVLAHDEGAATGLAVLAGTWAATGLIMVTSGPQTRNSALGLVLCAAAGALVVPAMVTVVSKPLMTIVLCALVARFALSGVFEFGGSAALRTAAGVLGVVISGLAWYAAAAFAFEDACGHTVLPTLRSQAFPPASAASGVETMSREAGVRARL